jgi:hypothetical protein
MIAKPMTVVSFRHSVEWFYGRFAPGRSLALLVSDYTEFGGAVGKSTDCDVEWIYGRFAPGRSLALLVSDYTFRVSMVLRPLRSLAPLVSDYRLYGALTAIRHRSASRTMSSMTCWQLINSPIAAATCPLGKIPSSGRPSTIERCSNTG